MNALIQIQHRDIDGTPAQTVNARDLHGFLEVGSAFKDWIARRIADYGFEDGKDFCSFLSESSGGRPAKEYALSLDMAKELSMVERNEKGKQARQYFLECERRAKVVSPAVALPDFTDPAAAAIAWAEQYRAKSAAEAERDEAVRTKAQIGSRREAQAMATASAAARKVRSLTHELGRNALHATVIAVENATHTRLDKQAWRALRKFCKDNGLSTEKVQDPRWGEVVAWPAAAWMAVFDIDLSRLFGIVRV